MEKQTLIEQRQELKRKEIKQMSNNNLFNNVLYFDKGDSDLGLTVPFWVWERDELRKELKNRLEEIGFLAGGEIKLFNRLTSKHDVFAIKPDENGKLLAYVGYYIPNENFHFEAIPFTNQDFKWKEETKK